MDILDVYLAQLNQTIQIGQQHKLTLIKVTFIKIPVVMNVFNPLWSIKVTV